MNADIKKILIWGTGKAAADFYENGVNGSIEGFVETRKSKEKFKDISVYEINDTLPYYDYIIVANTYSDEVYKLAAEKGMDIGKFIFLYPVKRRIGSRNLDVIAEILGEKNYTAYCLQYGLYEKSFFEKDLQEYKKKVQEGNFIANENELWPVLRDKYSQAGTIHNYFWQDLWAARLINRSHVKRHFDIGSRIDGFIAHLLAMDIDVTMIDIREFPEKVEGLHTIMDDATMLKQIPEDSIESISALCSLEHFGLGRYGDAIDPEACFKCFDEIQKRVKGGGQLYISLPIGRERVEFNAHRVFYPSTVLKCFPHLNLLEFSCTANGKMEYAVDIHKYDNDEHDGNYRYGLFHFIK